MEMLMCSHLAGMGTSTFSVFDDKKKGQLTGCDRFNVRDLSQRVALQLWHTASAGHLAFVSDSTS